MPAGIAASDRKILLIGGGLLLLMLTASVVLAPPAEESNSVPSTYSAQSGGAKAAYLLLSQLHYSVRRWESSPTELGADPNRVLLILAEPFQPPSEKEKKALADFVRNGGHLLFTGANIRMFFSDASVSNNPPDPEWKTFSPSIPSRFAVTARHVTIQPEAYWGALDSSQLVLYGEPDSAAVVSWKLGRGEILWWAGSTPLTNAGITKGDNLPFFLDALKNWSTGKAYEIYWDEYFHGQRSSLWSYVEKTSLVWGLLQIGVIALALLFTFSRRSGPVYIPAEVSRLSPLEYVETLGGLYERAGAAGSAVGISYQRFRSLLTRQLGLPSNTTDQELGHAAEERLGWKESGISDLLLKAASATRVEKLPRREALDLVQKLEGHAARLAIRHESEGENLTVQYLSQLAAQVRQELSKIVIGQREFVDQLLLVLVCGGHAVIEGVPGLAKTLAVKSLARICALGFQRVQCTADLMPADVTGTNVFNLSTSTFSLHRGPNFTDLLLVDEINRTSPRTQAALLEAMEERQVTIDGVRYPLSENFTVLATQNPIEFEGTYPLPEAQLDRFLLKVRVTYPSAQEEMSILSQYEKGFDPRRFEEIALTPLEASLLPAARKEIECVRVEPTLHSYVVSLVRRTRDWPAISLGASPRAAVGLFFVARALAGMEGRDYLLPDDVKAALPVLRHRILLKPEADLEGLTTDQVIGQVLTAVEVPK